jgi:hypothetical protein
VTEFEIKRVVIACDAAADVQLAAAAAAALAARQGAALHGVFFEDDNLHRLAQLEIAAHVGLAADVPLPAAPGDVLNDILRMRGGTMRRALQTAAARHHLSWSFDRVLSTESLPASEGDVLMIEAARRPFSGQWRPRSRLLTSMVRNPNTFLLRRGREGRVTVVMTPCDPATCERLVGAVFAFAEGDQTVVFMSSSAQNTGPRRSKGRICSQIDVRATSRRDCRCYIAIGSTRSKLVGGQRRGECERPQCPCRRHQLRSTGGEVRGILDSQS